VLLAVEKAGLLLCESREGEREREREQEREREREREKEKRERERIVRRIPVRDDSRVLCARRALL
jgi:hypothetical protein